MSLVRVGLCAALAFALSAAPGTPSAHAKPKQAKAEKVRRQARTLKKRFHQGNRPELGRTHSRSTDLNDLDELKESLHRVWSGRTLREGITSIVVADARTGEELVAIHPDDKLNPASNIKLVSTGTVLDIMPSDWQYETRLIAGLPVNGVVEGGLYLRGDWDPMLSPASLNALAETLHSDKITKINGPVWLSDSGKRDLLATLMRVDVMSYRKKNRKPDLKIRPQTDFIDVTTDIKVTRRGRHALKTTTEVVIEDGRPRLKVHISGQAKVRHSKRRSIVRLNLSKIPEVSGLFLDSAFRKAGIETSGTIRVGSFETFVAEEKHLPATLASHHSKSVRELLTMVNKRSLNWLADRLVMTAARQKRGGDMSMEGAIDEMHAYLGRIGVDPGQVVIDTGSGLSYNSEMSARQIIKVIRAATGFEETLRKKPKSHSIFLKSLATSGVDGTLKKRFRDSDLQGNIQAKTGTLTGVIALSGVIRPVGQRPLVFSILTNGTPHRRRNNVRKEHEAFVEAIDDYIDQTTDAEAMLAGSASQSP